MQARTPYVFLVIIGLSFLLLTIVFRSPVIALKAAVMNVLSIGAAFGVVIAVFQWGWGASFFDIPGQPIAVFMPMFLFAILFGLSMDYEVFLLSRIREFWAHGRETSDAVADGLAVTARVITAAAAIMVAVFLSLWPRPIQSPSSLDLVWPWRSSSTRPSSGWCSYRPRWSCWASGTGGSRTGSIALRRT